jgi:hypothetical protein
MFGGANEFLIAYICGLRTTSSWQHFQVQPYMMGDLDSAQCTHHTPYGEVYLHWQLQRQRRRQSQTLTLSLSIPTNSVADILLPLNWNNTLWKSVATALGSGSYEFSVQIN